MTLLADIYLAGLTRKARDTTRYRLPAAMLNDMVKLTPEQISGAADKWAATVEMRCKPSDALPIVEGLAVCARKAIESEQNVYLWNSV